MSRSRDPNNPSSTFFWKDYENDEGLRISSLSAQGLWMRLLCVAAKAEPFGYILINGNPLDATGVARLASVSEGEAIALVEELERNGVFSRDRKGRMFSRRMVKEAATRAKNKKNGRKGGNPALTARGGKEREKEGSVNPPLKGVDKPPYPYPYPFKKEEEEGARACDPPDFFHRVLAAAGLNGADRLPTWWMPPGAEVEVNRWLSIAPGILGPDQIIEFVAAEQSRHATPSSGPKAFERGLRQLAATLSAPTPTPIAINGRSRRQTDAEQLDDHLDILKARLAVERLG